MLAIILVMAGFAAGGLMGAPYLPTRKRDIAGIFELADLGPGQTLVELGSGDGTLLIAAAKRGIKSVGYEINPWLWLLSSLRVLPYRRLARVKLGDFWKADLTSADAVYVFLIPGKMERLNSKLEGAPKELKVISYAFEFPGRKPVKAGKNYWLYHYPNS